MLGPVLIHLFGITVNVRETRVTHDLLTLSPNNRHRTEVSLPSCRNLPAKPAEEAEKHQQQYEEMVAQAKKRGECGVEARVCVCQANSDSSGAWRGHERVSW